MVPQCYIAVVNSVLLHKELDKMRGDPGRTKPHTPSSLVCIPKYYGEDATALRRYCRRCSDAGNKTVKTPIYCTKCLVPLCLNSKKNCFEAWHTSD
ncbi:hypothetical protein OYC64_010263 [Pagothenia borchgrevinki]|uniref:PiggyBac transposable element-derived protein 4 C-terminal zinc-ribbon domain-containing protein n=1 Tax=Pagothenia borchgrevinki TaxID=8213 RepID=A0ABD2GVQ0_PAGBO